MDKETIYNPYSVDGQRVAAAFPILMRKTYLWMMLGLVMTALTAGYVASNLELMAAIFSNKLAFWGLIIAELGLVFFLSARIMRMSFATAGLLFAAYAILNGVTLSCIFMIYSVDVIVTTFAVSAATFGAMSLLGFVVKRDLSPIGRFGLMAVVGLIIASVVNMFVASSALYWGITYLGVLIFAGLTAYDTQKLKMLFLQHGNEVNDSTQKLALLGSLTLYLDFVNLFLYLLRIFGGNRN